MIKYKIVKFTNGKGDSYYSIKVCIFGIFSYWMRDDSYEGPWLDPGPIWFFQEKKTFNTYKTAVNFVQSLIDEKLEKKISKKVVCEISSNGKMDCKSSLESFENE